MSTAISEAQLLEAASKYVDHLIAGNEAAFAQSMSQGADVIISRYERAQEFDGSGYLNFLSTHHFKAYVPDQSHVILKSFEVKKEQCSVEVDLLSRQAQKVLSGPEPTSFQFLVFDRIGLTFAEEAGELKAGKISHDYHPSHNGKRFDSFTETAEESGTHSEIPEKHLEELADAYVDAVVKGKEKQWQDLLSTSAKVTLISYRGTQELNAEEAKAHLSERHFQHLIPEGSHIIEKSYDIRPEEASVCIDLVSKQALKDFGEKKQRIDFYNFDRIALTVCNEDGELRVQNLTHDWHSSANERRLNAKNPPGN